MPPSREHLDVEDDDAREERIRSLLEKTNAAAATAATAAATRPAPFPTLPPSKPHPVPISDLISRAEAFLPRLAASNADLAQRAAHDPTSVDIEHLGDNPEGSTHIEMNLGLGVFEQRPRPRPYPSGHGPDNRRENGHRQPSSDSASSSSSPSSSEHSGDDSVCLDDSEGTGDANDADDTEEQEEQEQEQENNVDDIASSATETAKTPDLFVPSTGRHANK